MVSRAAQSTFVDQVTHALLHQSLAQAVQHQAADFLRLSLSATDCDWRVRQVDPCPTEGLFHRTRAAGEERQNATPSSFVTFAATAPSTVSTAAVVLPPKRLLLLCCHLCPRALQLRPGGPKAWAALYRVSLAPAAAAPLPSLQATSSTACPFSQTKRPLQVVAASFGRRRLLPPAGLYRRWPPSAATAGHYR